MGVPKWKSESKNVHDLKFEYVDIDQFIRHDLAIHVKYVFLFLLITKSVLVYLADLWTAISLLAFSELFTTQVLNVQKDGWSGFIPKYSKYIFVTSIFLSYLLLLWEARKARRVERSHDISMSFTNRLVYRKLSLRSYPHFCFFDAISNQLNTRDAIAFWVFFTLRGWKRLLLSDAPRQVINILNIALTVMAVIQMRGRLTTDIDDYIPDRTNLKLMSVIIILSTVTIFVISAIIMAAAAIMYVPLVFNIRGNLKEYCCYKIDKRLAELLKKHSRRRIAIEQKLQKTDLTSLAEQPTLPQVFLDDQYEDTKSTSGKSLGSTYGPANSAYNSPYPPVTPPLPPKSTTPSVTTVQYAQQPHTVLAGKDQLTPHGFVPYDTSYATHAMGPHDLAYSVPVMAKHSPTYAQGYAQPGQQPMMPHSSHPELWQHGMVRESAGSDESASTITTGMAAPMANYPRERFEPPQFSRIRNASEPSSHYRDSADTSSQVGSRLDSPVIPVHVYDPRFSAMSDVQPLYTASEVDSEWSATYGPPAGSTSQPSSSHTMATAVPFASRNRPPLPSIPQRYASGGRPLRGNQRASIGQRLSSAVTSSGSDPSLAYNSERQSLAPSDLGYSSPPHGVLVDSPLLDTTRMSDMNTLDNYEYMPAHHGTAVLPPQSAQSDRFPRPAMTSQSSQESVDSAPDRLGGDASRIRYPSSPHAATNNDTSSNAGSHNLRTAQRGKWS